MVFDSVSSTQSSSDDEEESITPVASPVPELPPKSRNSSFFNQDVEKETTPSKVRERELTFLWESRVVL